MYHQGRIFRGAGEGLQPPYSWCNNGDMGRMREKKRWRKEEKWREKRKKKRSAPLDHIMHPPLCTI
jgi:hypothetical protein